jgi:hypothetical protein
MNKQEIANVVGMFDLSADVAKSLVNRLESALTKEGTPSAKLRMASSSLLALSDKCDEESNDEAVTLALGSFLAIFAEIAKDQAPKASTTQAPKAPKATREKWFDADSHQKRKQSPHRSHAPRNQKRTQLDLAIAGAKLLGATRASDKRGQVVTRHKPRPVTRNPRVAGFRVQKIALASLGGNGALSRTHYGRRLCLLEPPTPCRRG